MQRLTFDIQKFDFFDESNPSFLRGKIWAISEGGNRNKCYFTFESIENSIPTVYNKPVLACYDKSQEGFKAHNDNGIKYDDETDEYFVDFDQNFMDGVVEKPIGLIPSDSIVKIEKDKDGVNWLTFDVLIWTKYNYKATKLLKKLKREKVSVEITISDYEDNEGIRVIKDFTFDGVTIIGVTEGIEGAHIKVADYAQSDKFNNFQEAFMFAYNGDEEHKNLNDKTEGENSKVKFDFKNMGISDFNRKIRKVLEDFRFKREGEDYLYGKYWMVDVYPDQNEVILEDCEENILIKVPFYINDERDVIIDWEKKEEVEITYFEATYKKKVDFAAHLVRVEDSTEKNKTASNKKTEEGEFNEVDIKFKERFGEKGLSPVFKLGDIVLFSKKEEQDILYKLEFDLIEKSEEENFEEIVSQITVFDFIQGNKDNFVEKVEFETIKTEKEALELSAKEKDEKFAEITASLEDSNKKHEALKAEFDKVQEECAKFKGEKFELEAKEFIDGLKEAFDTEQDMFVTTVFEKIKNKEISDMAVLEKFAGEQLLIKTQKALKNRQSQYSLNEDNDKIVIKKNKGNITDMI